MRKISTLLIAIILFSCQDSKDFNAVEELGQLNGFWKSGTNIIEINADDSSLTFNNLKKHKLTVEIIDSNFFLLGKNMYGDESFNGLIKINFDGNRISVKRSDNHYKYLVGAKTLYDKVSGYN
mgnify:FL=1|tara:strand:- start:3120 stop:3488 length:369 start_codon:yes stop_codon:yes gene_type:complete